MLIETHCHLDYLKSEPLEELLLKAQEAQITKIITIGVAPENLDTAREIALKYEQVYYTQGIHPHDAKDATEIEFDKIAKRSLEKKMLAVGEIGLDYHYNNSPVDVQRSVFEKQLQLACDYDLPVVIHTREADEDTIAILKNFSSKLKRRGVIHSFTSTMELAEWVLSDGFYLGFNGIITFKKAENVQEVVKMAPMERILLETDSPFLTPVPHRGKENAPHYLPFVAQKVADLKSLDVEFVRTQALGNSLRCFHKLNS
jgi:TatD DNase family protein